MPSALCCSIKNELPHLGKVLERDRIKSSAQGIHLPCPVVFRGLDHHIPETAVARPAHPHLHQDFGDIHGGNPVSLKEPEHQLKIS